MEEKVKESDITLENDVATWDLLYHGAIAGSYMGTFKFRCFMTPMQLLEADRDYRELLGTNASFAATEADNVAYCLAQLKQRIIESPPFWKEGGGRFPGGALKDLEILNLVLEAAVQAEVKYRKALTQRHEDAINRMKAHMEKRKEMEKINDEIQEDKGQEAPKA